MGKKVTDRMSDGFRDGVPYLCQHEWPDDCFLQGGRKGLVFTKGTLQEAVTNPEVAVDVLAGNLPHYKTAFFEAFPTNPSTFLRGEGKDMVEAEEQAWQEFQKILSCPQHAFERRNYTNGYGFCINCDLGQSNAFPTICVVCGMHDSETDFWGRCKDHEDLKYQEEYHRRNKEMQEFLKNYD